nr:MAG TPA: hypothetical protein [Caudoviricetes sp.]DAP25171.1 MAG TPA: hypothetical protein [Caudoviricetes sp.]
MYSAFLIILIISFKTFKSFNLFFINNVFAC